MAQKIVYLDQNKWIELSKAYYGIESNPDIKRACTIVIKASESGKAIFPLSVAHLEETLKNSSQERRKRLIDFMIKVSDCYTILPYINLMDYEVENAIRKRIGYPIINLRDYAIGKGISTMVGAKPTINGILPPMKDVNHIQNMNIPDTLKSRLIDSIGTENTSKIIEDWVKSPDGFKWILIRSADSGHKTDNNNDLELIEKIRAEDSKIIDNDLRFRVVLTKSIMQILSLTIARIHQKLGLAKDAIITKEWTRDDIMRFVEDIPSFFVLFYLSYRRDSNLNREIKIGDLNDISALSVAIPYCDIIVAEKMFTSIAKQGNLNKKYDTIILDKVTELENYIS